MQQTCMTELSELCVRLEKDFDLSRHSGDGKIVLQGDTYNIINVIDPDKRERVCYHDKIVTVAFSDGNGVFYKVAGKYLSGQKIVLDETRLGRRILHKLNANMAEIPLSDEQKNTHKLVARVMYLNNDEVFDLIKSFIFA